MPKPFEHAPDCANPRGPRTPGAKCPKGDWAKEWARELVDFIAVHGPQAAENKIANALRQAQTGATWSRDRAKKGPRRF